MTQAAEELGPKRFRFAVSHGQAEDLAVTRRGDPGGHHDRFGYHLVQVGVPDLEVGGVQVQVGELDMSELAVSEGGDLNIETGADPRDLAAGDARAEPNAATRSSTLRVEIPST